MDEFNVEEIAKVCHEANRAYCATLLDGSQPAWEDAPEWQKKSAVSGVEFHLKHLRSGVNPPPSASHDAWLEEKRADGWKWGEAKDTEKKEHPCFVPYNELPTDQRRKDFIFGAIVKAYFDTDRNN